MPAGARAARGLPVGDLSAVGLEHRERLPDQPHVGLGPHVAYAEDGAGHRAVAAADHEPLGAQATIEVGPVDPGRDLDRGDRRGGHRARRRVQGVADLREPAAAEGRHVRVPPEAGFEPFRKKGLGPGVQAGRGLPARGVGEVVALDGGLERLDRVVAGVVDRLDRLPGGRAHRQETGVRQRGEALLGAAETQVDVPLVRQDRGAADAGNGVDVEERDPGFLFQAAQPFERVERAGGGLAVHGRDHLGPERGDGLGHRREVGQGLVVGQPDRADLGADRRGHVADPVAEDAGPDREDAVPGREAALQRPPERHHAFPEEDHDPAAGLQDALEVGFGLGVELDVLAFEVGRPVVDPVGGEHIRVGLHRPGDHGDGVGFHGGSFR